MFLYIYKKSGNKHLKIPHKHVMQRLHAAQRVRRMLSAGVGKPALRTKASSEKTHTLPENARVLWIHLRKATCFTFMEKKKNLEEKPARSRPWIT